MALGMGTDFRFDIFARDRSGPAWRGVENSVQRTRRAVDGFMRAAGPLLGLSGAVSVGALTFATREALNYADALVQAADRTSFAVEELEALRYAGRLNRVQFQQTDMALQRFSRRVAEAANGSGELEGDLTAMGIALRDSEGRMRSSYEILLDYADAVADAESEQEQLRLAFKAFDSEGAAFVTVMRQGRAGLENYGEQARETGAIMGDELARNAAEAATAFERMQLNFEANRNRAVAEQAENLEALADQLSRIVTLGVEAAGAMGAFFASFEDEDSRAGRLFSGMFGMGALGSGDDPTRLRDAYRQTLEEFRGSDQRLDENRLRRIMEGAGLQRIEIDSFLDAFGGPSGLMRGFGGFDDRTLARLERALEMRVALEGERVSTDPIVVEATVRTAIEEAAARAGLSGDSDDGDPPDRNTKPDKASFGEATGTGLDDKSDKEAARQEEREARAQLAREQAEEYARALEDNRERFAGEFARTMTDGWMAAFDGNLAEFAARRLRDALYDQLFDLFSRLGDEIFEASGDGASSGGFIGTVLRGGASLLGFGGGRAAGGPVQPGKFYAWQEQGREFFAPTVPGQVMRADGMGSGAPVIVNQFHLHAEGAVMTDELMREMDAKAEAAARGAVAVSRNDMARARSRQSKRLR